MPPFLPPGAHVFHDGDNGSAALLRVRYQRVALEGEGLLVVAGMFPTQPYRVAFSFKYMYEVPRWKLFGIDVNLLAPQ